MIARVQDLQGIAVQAQSDLKTLIDGVASKTGLSEQSAKLAYAARYNAFVKEVNPDLIPRDGEHNAELVQTRLSTIGISQGDRRHVRDTPEGLADVRDNAMEVHAVLSKLNVDQRVDLMNSFRNAVMGDDKLNPVLSTMITVAVGKSKAAADGELSKAMAWFDFLADEEQKRVIKDTGGFGVKPEGFHVRDGKGQAIESIEQLTGKVNATAYEAPEFDVMALPLPGEETKGNAITFSQPPRNYPFALGIGDPLLAMYAGNGAVMRVPAEMQDIMDTFSRYWNRHIAEYAREHQAKLGLSDADVLVLEKEKALQIVTGYRHETIATNARVVSSLETGRRVYESYVGAKGEGSVEAQRFAAELAGANVMYVGPDLTDKELQLAAKQWLARVIDNNGMICTKIEDGMVHKAVAHKFAQMVAEEWSNFDASTIDKPHDDGKVHGVHTDPGSLQKARLYLDDAKAQGATVIGGQVTDNGLSMTPAMVLWPPHACDYHLDQRSENDENFAPISNFMPVRDVYEAIEITNISDCNLTSSIWTKDPRALGAFIHNTKLGSYNVFNPKHGSDNAPIGEHGGVYHNVYFTPGGQDEERVLHIESNGVTGGHSQILAQLGIPGVQHAKKAIHIDGTALAQFEDTDNVLLFNIKSLAASGVDLARDTEISAEEIVRFVAANSDEVSLEEIAPSIAG